MARPVTSTIADTASSNTPSGDSIETVIGSRITVRPDGCWIYGAGQSYGRTMFGKAGRVVIHRFVYETLVGPIDEGCHLHHRCEVKQCCNPEHLVVLTPKEHAAEHKRLRRGR